MYGKMRRSIARAFLKTHRQTVDVIWCGFMRDLKNLPINGGFPYTQKKHWQKKEIYKCATLYNSSDDAGHKGVFKFWNGEKFWLLLSLTTWKLLNLGDDRLMGDWNRRSLDKWQHQRALPVSNPPPVLIFYRYISYSVVQGSRFILFSSKFRSSFFLTQITHSLRFSSLFTLFLSLH